MKRLVIVSCVVSCLFLGCSSLRGSGDAPAGALPRVTLVGGLFVASGDTPFNAADKNTCLSVPKIEDGKRGIDQVARLAWNTDEARRADEAHIGKEVTVTAVRVRIGGKTWFLVESLVPTGNKADIRQLNGMW